MEGKMVIVFGLVVSVFLQSVAAQTAHVVGDTIGWSIPSSGAQAYVTWAANNKFVVGDTLIFNFVTTAHDVQKVPKASFDSCSSSNAIGSAITTGPANVSFTSAGDHYFICTFGSHCQSGQKLAITVSGSAGSPGPSPSVPSPPPSVNSPPTTPSPTSNNPDACAPVPAPSPSSTGEVPTTGKTGQVAPPPTPTSSSRAVFASFFLSSLALVMGLFF